MVKKIISKGARGFTLIELLVVISIIGFLVTIVILALNNARRSSRDGSRKQIAAQFRKALELYYTNTSPSGYPLRSTEVYFNDATLAAAMQPYLGQMPVDPSCKGTCTNPPYNFQYISNATGSEYAVLVPFDNDTSGVACKFTTPGGTSLTFTRVAAPICSYQK